MTTPNPSPSASPVLSRVTLYWQVTLAAYMQLISWIPLGRWNYQSCCPPGLTQLRDGTLTIVDTLPLLGFTLPLLIFWYGQRRNRRWAMWSALTAYGVWLALQLISWWPPYLFGASSHWASVYERAFAQATQILPRWGSHLPPDAMHLVLQALLVGVLWSGIAALRRSQSMAAAARQPELVS